jgi:hypothetical protein
MCTATATTIAPARKARQLKRPAIPKQPEPEAPLYQWVMKPANGVGFIVIRGTLYRLQEVQYDEADGTPRTLVKLRKADGSEYQITPTADGPACDCPDAIYRSHEHTCKHVQAVRAAYGELDRLWALDVFLNDDARDYLNCAPVPL